MKNLIATLVLATAASASAALEWEPSLERPISGDRVVLNDQTYVLLSVPDYEALQQKFTFLATIARKQWDAQHSSEQGRTEWHGKKTTTLIGTNETGRLIKTTEYADGYRHVEEGQKIGASGNPAPAPIKKPFSRNPTMMELLKKRRAPDVTVNKEMK